MWFPLVIDYYPCGEVQEEEPEPDRRSAVGVCRWDVPDPPAWPERDLPEPAWAQAAALLVSWRDGRPWDVPRVLCAAEEPAGALSLAAAGRLFERLRLAAEPLPAGDVRRWLALMRRYGPLWLAESPPGEAGFAADRACVLTGLHGDGSPGGTFVTYAALPAGGRRIRPAARLLAEAAGESPLLVYARPQP